MSAHHRVELELKRSFSVQLPLYIPVTLLRLNAGNCAPSRENAGTVLFVQVSLLSISGSDGLGWVSALYKMFLNEEVTKRLDMMIMPTSSELESEPLGPGRADDDEDKVDDDFDLQGNRERIRKESKQISTLQKSCPQTTFIIYIVEIILHPIYLPLIWN